MTVYELVERLNGEIVSNKAYVRVDGAPVVVGVVGERALELTEEGVALAAKLDTPKPASTKRGFRNKPADVTGEE